MCKFAGGKAVQSMKMPIRHCVEEATGLKPSINLFFIGYNVYNRPIIEIILRIFTKFHNRYRALAAGLSLNATYYISSQLIAPGPIDGRRHKTSDCLVSYRRHYR